MKNNWGKLADRSTIERTKSSLENKGYEVFVVEKAEDALSEIKELIPKGASVMNGSSVTLEQIGFVDYLKSGEHRWNNIHKAIVEEKDPIKQSMLRKQAALSDYYLGSVHALLENGEFIVASNTASQLPHIASTSQNLIFVVGAQKIVPSLKAAMERLEEYVVPLENEHMMQKYGSGTSLNKILIFKGENPMLDRKIRFILVNKKLGF
ncbi:MAG: hypothetical protein A2958_01080 [Candidatus Levybacteria bacterium RIFCSPLOWO2_01_FULL_38_13]|nr:MAG: hypothetical protein A2629_00975 [Candidatus Levybacteria bacterium RIFCSPHIGHO2_01_FULL_41_15]OGH34880.1 MAG: hypothetical protein A2958_01080 [Candidatus Levybacteria bacterium RIFCSPLOWO2_01_FULL_38_13]